MKYNAGGKIDKIMLKFCESGENFYLLDAITSQAYTINEISKRILELYLENKDDIFGQLKNEYDLTKDQEDEIQSFLNDLAEKKIINRTLKDLKQALPTLKNITLGITGRCNLRCRHCLAASTFNRGEEISLELAADIARQAEKMNVQSISLFGGEPLIHQDFFAIAEEFSKAMQVKLNTNATLIDAETAKRIKELNISPVTVSIDGSTAKTHDTIRGTGAFEKVIKGVRHLTDNKVAVLLSATVHSLNFQDVASMVELALKMGVTGIRFNEVHFGGFAACQAKQIALSGEEKEILLKGIENIKEQHGDFVSGSLCDLSDLKKEDRKKDFPLVIPPCGAAMGSLCIRPDCFVTPCEILWDEKTANLKKDTLEEAYYLNEKFNEFRRPKIIEIKDVPACEDCGDIANCFYGHRCAPFHYPGKNLQEKVLLNCLKTS